eukprot:TRINITY_DN823_c0_g1_i23.p1 TRINITY_DN823_c0_g1~~TRINITY_DN823_c0_g1_i23.p1  ORF type:complete len:178 (+),score=77.49 TRINITY_DN823_c0_g1_i23:512-1045(+)
MIAQWYEEDFEYELAISYYLKAADLQDIESSDSFGLQCMLKAADLMVMSKEDKYVEAIQKYEMAASKYLKTQLLKSAAKDLILKALLLYLAIDDNIGAARSLDKFKDEDPTFEGSRECNLIEGIMKTLEEKNKEDYEELLYNYNKITPFDKLKTKVLVKVKEQFKSEVEKLESDGFT